MASETGFEQRDSDFDHRYFVVSESISERSLDRLIVREVKAKGLNVIIVGDSPKLAQRVQNVAKRRSMTGRGYAFFLLPEAFSYHSLSYEDGLLLLQPYTPTIPTSDNHLTELLCQEIVARFLPGLPLPTDMLVYNYQSEKYVPVFRYSSAGLAAIGDNAVIYPGGVRTPPPHPFPVTLNINLGNTNPTMGANLNMPTYTFGAMYAIDIINTRLHLFSDMQLQYSELDYGVNEFNATWALPKICSGIAANKGFAYIVGPISIGVIGVIDLLKSINVTLPMVGTTTSAALLSSSSDFPYFVRVYVSDDYLVVTYARMIHFFGWHHCAVLYQNDTWGRGAYHTFSEVAETFGITIANDERMRAVDTSITNMTIRRFKGEFEEVVRSKARVVLLIFYDQQAKEAISYLYDLGVRRGDVLFLAIEWLSLNWVTDPLDPSLFKQRELLLGSLMCIPEAYIGPLGSDLSAQLQSHNMSSNHMPCFYYDAALLTAYALKDSLWAGIDYDNPDDMISMMRKSRFTGCTGVFSLEEGTNDRSLMSYGIYNLQYNSTTDQWSLTKVLIFDPLAVQVFKLLGDFQWPDGSDSIPADIRDSEQCEINAHYREFTPGKILLITACAVALLISLLSQCLVWCFTSAKRHRKLRSRREFSYSDLMVYVQMTLETLQIISIGPVLDRISPSLVSLASISTAAIINNAEARTSYFYMHVYSGIFLVSLWIALNLATFFHVWERAERSEVARIIEGLAEWLIPALANYGFLPILALFLELFACDTAFSNSFETSVLFADCQLLCWRAYHSGVTLLSALLICIYVPMAILIRPFWEESDENLHIRSLPLMCVAKTTTQIGLIFIQKTLRKSPPHHRVAYICLISSFLAVLLCGKVFTYARAKLWQIISMLAVLWVEAVDFLSEKCDFGRTLTTGVLMAGLALLWLVATIVQRVCVPNLLYSPPGVDMMKLFKFGFSLRAPEPAASFIVRRFRLALESQESQEMQNIVRVPKCTIHTGESSSVA